jgi:hypothetical protein
MKNVFKLFAILLLAVLPLSLLAQNATIVLNYMKVNPGMDGDYVQSEREGWKPIHEKRIEAGVMSGWQLWRNVYAGADDPYQYITIDWYESIAHSLKGDPEGFWENEITTIFTEEEGAKYWEMTMNSRTLSRKDVLHRTMQAENNTGNSKYIFVNRMKVKPGMNNAYREAEGTYSKPLQEAKIEDGQMSHWSVWQAWPYKEGQVRFSTVDGYESLEQLSAGGDDLLEKVHPGLTWEDWYKKVGENRTMASVELWELVDFAFPAAE